MEKRFNFRDAVEGTIFGEGGWLDITQQDRPAAHALDADPSYEEFREKFVSIVTVLSNSSDELGFPAPDDAIDILAKDIGQIYTKFWNAEEDGKADQLAGVVRGIIGGAFGVNEDVQNRFAEKIEPFLPGDSGLKHSVQEALGTASWQNPVQDNHQELSM